MKNTANGAIIVPDHAVVAACPFGHEWNTTAQTVNRGMEHREGWRKPKPRFETHVAADRCPECGAKWGRLIPRSVEGQ